MLETDGGDPPGQLLPPHWLGTKNKQLELGQWRRKVPEPAETNTLFPATHTQLWNPCIWSRAGGFLSSPQASEKKG